MEDFNDWIRIIEQNSFNRVYNYLVKDTKNLLFDISFPQVVRIVNKTPPGYLVISHFHLDHHTGKNRIKKKFRTKIITHKLEVKAINSIEGFYENYDFENGTELINELHLKYWGFKGVQIDRMVEDKDEINTGNHRLKVIHTPGTTPGHICLLDEEEKILFAGDMGPLEIPVYNAITSNVSDYLDSYDRIISLDPKVILSAHFPPITRNIKEKYEKAKQKIINRENRIIEIIRENKNATLHEISNENPTIIKKNSNEVL
ncbi:MAG: MBL fold metallo-hydrolase, partial [Candidatus Lokiarchaeota archaeon]|nr:MBL fold metallo-hydrolase [Candidatus Lokiarchaeota archaeon]